MTWQREFLENKENILFYGNSGGRPEIYNSLGIENC